MENKHENGLNKQYVIVVSVFTFLLPAICTFIEMNANKHIQFSFSLIGKWFIFSAVGLRLFVAGIKQSADPAFTAKQIFHIDSKDSFPIVRELGFSNLCFGLLGIMSLFFPQWRIASTFVSGLYYGIAGLQHLIKGAAGANEKLALITDLIICLVLIAYFVMMV